MLPPPPRPARRLLLAPAVFLLCVAAVLVFPVTALIAGLISTAVPRSRGRPLRILLVVTGYCAMEATALVALLGLWLAAGFGRRERQPTFERIHYRLVHQFLNTLFTLTSWALRVRVTSEGPEPSAFTGRPLLVFSRHGGPGDSFLLVHALIDWYEREPRIVLKDLLQWDPAIDVVLSRLPNRFIRPGSRQAGRSIEYQIRALAYRLDENDALLIFPEGGNFTTVRWERAIKRLWQAGLRRYAARAVAMRNVLAPHPGGVLAALEAAHGADVVWVAHTGTDHLFTMGDIWRALPMDQAIKIHWWQVPPGEVPPGRDERIEWLYSWWERIDQWIEANRLAPHPNPSRWFGRPGRPGRPARRRPAA